MEEKTIVEKLQLAKYQEAVILDIPKDSDYFRNLSSYGKEMTTKKYDLIFKFVQNLNELVGFVHQIISEDKLLADGYVFIAYPKKGNKKWDTYVHRDELMPALKTDEEGYIGQSNLKFARMVALDETYTVVGMKEATKLKIKGVKKNNPSADEYADYVPQVVAFLADKGDLATFYSNLATGYQRVWARYIYSAKQAATQEKRRLEMVDILSQGYKTKEHFRQGKK
ncbi:YdeI/OmpD-associated family protein [Listeria ivanovii]|uniref:YdeI/OmpD-associated family protein n=1 Tax=Listeria ivanovii TaxID=1638 RepID=UPI00051270DA|nr:YdeI/OmpD-associated family protein [Listeria ivanovii]AIS62158.1 LAAC [Listeria ivanovii subsp. londoniensis]MBC2255636.1 YdeI/OmpD-associated family protein [Listeria ivanovii]MBK1965465.1 YdeI/OmpD-associated family protein [Listeria ivanovii subsp. londoniensis]MBK1983292.1 YdeI/OmpD-associated family protein [Listeria ivanovii subsp. londoniensis]MBK1994632.1 YdeI/OmpD-associated family protein [Listeria ivanovii subsp. londoniensis]